MYLQHHVLSVIGRSQLHSLGRAYTFSVIANTSIMLSTSGDILRLRTPAHAKVGRRPTHAAHCRDLWSTNLSMLAATYDIEESDECPIPAMGEKDHKNWPLTQQRGGAMDKSLSV